MSGDEEAPGLSASDRQQIADLTHALFDVCDDSNNPQLIVALALADCLAFVAGGQKHPAAALASAFGRAKRSLSIATPIIQARRAREEGNACET